MDCYHFTAEDSRAEGTSALSIDAYAQWVNGSLFNAGTVTLSVMPLTTFSCYIASLLQSIEPVIL